MPICETSTTIAGTLADMLAEARELAASLPLSHLILSEVQAVVFTGKLHSQGFEISLPEAAACIDRLRIMVETGVYPGHLLKRNN